MSKVPAWITRFEYDAQALIKRAIDDENRDTVAANNILAYAAACKEIDRQLCDPVAQYLATAALTMHEGVPPKKALNLIRKKGQKKQPSGNSPDMQIEIAQAMEAELKRLQSLSDHLQGETPYEVARETIADEYDEKVDNVHRYYKKYRKEIREMETIRVNGPDMKKK